MNRILFVDDEPGILDGLRNSLRRQRSRWEMVFAASGAEALEEIGRGAFDLVVSDMRMPRMDGAELLGRIREQAPATIRIVLSGHAEQEAILRTLPVAHQFLGKPCDPEHLRETIDRACRLTPLVGRDGVRRTVGALHQLPSLPRNHDALVQALSSPQVSIGDIGAIVEQDPAMSIKVLQLVNSAYFGTGMARTSIRDAVAYLGLELLETLVLRGGVFSTVGAPEAGALCLDRFQQHSLRMARLMRRFFEGDRLAEEAFTLGLVHDIGAVVLARAFPAEYVRLAGRVRDQTVDWYRGESEAFGVSHAEAGACLLGMWGLPPSIVDAVAFHHRPASLAGQEGRRLLAALHVASTVIADPVVKGCEPAHGPGLDRAFLEDALPVATLEAWLRIAADEGREATR